MTAICLSTAGAAFGMDEDASSIHPAIGIQGWFSSAFAKWQISFPYVTRSDNRAGNTPAGTRGKIESELDFDNIDSPIWIITGGAAIGPDFSFEVLLGTGSIGNGHGTDTDRFLADSGGGLEFSQSKNDIDGNVKLGELNFYFNNHRFSGKHDGPWGAVLGYTHYEDQLHMTNAVQTVSETFDGTVFPPKGPFPPGLVLNSNFDFSWDALKVGVLFQPSLTEQLSFIGTLSVYPFVEYKGDGFWNLRAGSGRNDFRSQPPNFTQTSSTGYGYDVSVGLAYAVLENLELSAGYRIFYLRATNGTDTTFFADGTSDVSNLDWATVTRQGVYAGVLYKF